MKYIIKQLLLVSVIFGLCICLSWAGAEEEGIYYGSTTDGSVYVAGYTGTLPATLTIPAEHEGKPVIGISRAAFYQCGTIVNVILPETIRSIDSHAFRECPKLKTVDLSKTKPWLGEYVFSDNPLLTTVKMPETGMSKVTRGLFQNCKNLREIIIPDGVTEIENYAFYNCEKLNKVIIPDTVADIWGYSFYGCKALTTVTLPKSLKILKVNVFENCTALTTVHLPEGLEEIQEKAFYECVKLKDIVLPEGLKTIGAYAFGCCEDIETLELPESLTAVGEGAFLDCYSLKAINVPELITELPKSTFNGCRSMKQVTLSANLKKIGIKAFKDCKALANIDLPMSVNDIGESAFYGCAALKKISIPRGVAFLRTEIFRNCTALKQIIVPDSVRGIGKRIFSTKPTVYCYKDSTIATWAKDNGCKRVFITDETLAAIQTLSIPETMTLEPGTQRWLKVAAYPQVKYGTLEIESNAPEIVSVNGDVLIANRYGEATITATLNGVSASCRVNVDLASWIELPADLVQVRAEAFAGMNAPGVKVPHGVESIGARAFADSDSLELVLMPDSVTSIADDAFEGCENVEFICASMNAAAAYAQEKGIPFSVE